MAEIKKVGVLGAGMMGAEIALVCALAGYEVLLKEINMDLANAGYERIKGSLEKWTKKGKLKADASEKQKALNAITPTDTYDGFEDVDIVIEAVLEDVAIKTKTFQELAEICNPACIIASNTSSISITKLGASFSDKKRTEQFVGLHFFSPASIMKLVEVIQGENTSDATMEIAYNFCKSIAKEPRKVKDIPGFVLNRMLMALQNEAVRLYEEGIASVEDIDKACVLGAGHPVGPLALMDFTSIDLSMKIGQMFYEAYGERCRNRPAMVKKVNAGHLGRKTGRGWYSYEK
jgi:3-hydroxybutyryl-CoA dehydrogenase